VVAVSSGPGGDWPHAGMHAAHATTHSAIERRRILRFAVIALL